MSDSYEIKQRKGHEAFVAEKIKLGDCFRWKFAEGFATSGTLKKKYMAVSKNIVGDIIMQVVERHSGRNGYGYFADYVLRGNGIDIRINGFDALKMERVPW